MSRQKSKHVERIIVGNQLMIMRALADAAGSGSRSHRVLHSRVADIKEWWLESYGETVGYSAEWGDTPPR